MADSDTIGTATPARDAELVRVVRELVDAAIAVRPYVLASSVYLAGLLLEHGSQDAAELIDRLDAATADAGELLAEVSS